MVIGGMDPARHSPGTELNRMMDKMGFPDVMGDLYGAALDKAVGNQAGVARNLFDAFKDIKTGNLDLMTGLGFAPPGFAPRPNQDFPRLFGPGQKTFYDKESISTVPKNGIEGALGQKEVFLDGKKIDVGKENKNATPAKLEAKILTDPAFRQKIENQVGGRIVLDGNADGNITIAKKLPHPCMPYQNHVHQNVGNFLERALKPPMGVLNGVLNQLNGFLKGLQGGGQPGGPGQAGAAGGPGGAGQAGDSGKLDKILNDPNMSFEAKLAAFMMEVVKEKQAQMKEKMGELKAMQDKKKAGGGEEGGGGGGGKGGKGGKGGGGKGGKGGKGKGGGGKGLGSLLQMGGGLIGGMYGGPVGAAMGQQLGGAIGGAVSGGGGAGGASAAGGGAGKAGGKGEEGSEQLAMEELKQISDEFKRMMDAMQGIRQNLQDVTLKTTGQIGR